MMKKILYILYQPYKYLVFLPMLIISTIFFGTVGIVLAAIFNPRIASKICAVGYARLNCYLTPVFVKVFGKEYIDKKQSYVVVSNHQSHFDSLVLCGWSGIDLRWVMKQELRKIPIFGFACKMGEFIYVDRSNREAAIASIKAAKERIKKGTSVMFFVEGTRSLTGKLGEFKKGAFKMAQDLNIPILPVSIVNTGKILKAKTLKLFPGRARMVFHKPIEIIKNGQDKLDAIMLEVKKAIQSGLDEYAF